VVCLDLKNHLQIALNYRIGNAKLSNRSREMRKIAIKEAKEHPVEIIMTKRQM
jgi:hypothetical protein